MKSYVSPAEQALGLELGKSSVEQRIAATLGRRETSDPPQIDVVRLDAVKFQIEYGQVGHE